MGDGIGARALCIRTMLLGGVRIVISVSGGINVIIEEGEVDTAGAHWVTIRGSLLALGKHDSVMSNSCL